MPSTPRWNSCGGRNSGTGRWPSAGAVIPARPELRGELRHYTTESITHRIRKNDEYASVAAEELFRAGKRASLLELLFILPLSMARDLFLKAGILDGRRGVILAALGAFYSFSKYAKLWELARESPRG